MQEESNVAAAIAGQLGEEQAVAQRQIAEIVEVLGEGVALRMLAEARELQRVGGLFVKDGSRRRTLGGVFFQLARRDLSREARQRIFYRQVGGSQAPVNAMQEAAREERPTAGTAGPRRRIVEVNVTAYETRAVASGVTVGTASGIHIARIRITEALAPLTKPARQRLLKDLLAELATARVPSAAAPIQASAPESPSPGKATKAAYVLSLPQDMPASRVVERARAEGILLAVNQVYSIRSAARRQPR